MTFFSMDDTWSFSFVLVCPHLPPFRSVSPLSKTLISHCRLDGRHKFTIVGVGGDLESLFYGSCLTLYEPLYRTPIPFMDLYPFPGHKTNKYMWNFVLVFVRRIKSSF